MNSNDVRDVVPKEVVKSFDDIVNGIALGASNHIKMISNIFVAISNEYESDIALRNIKLVSEFFKATRGNSSYAIVTALNQMETLISEEHGELSECVSNAIEKYFEIADNNNKKIFEYTNRLLTDIDSIMIFDYSSTVEKAVVKCSHKLEVYIPESRVINGGLPFVKNIIEASHDVHFIPDAAMLTVLNKVQMVFIGAETFYPDGTAFNTVGSDILAEICNLHHVPYYVLTPLLKNDARAVYGVFKPTLLKDLKNTLGLNWDTNLINRVDFTSVELVSIKPELITGYVTEKGILKPSALINFVYKEDL